MNLFGEVGFHGATVPQVAERAQVATGTIYRYFPSKEALVNAVFQREKEAVGRVLMADVRPDAPIREQFHAFWRRYAKHAIDHRASFAFLELHHHGPYLDETSRAVEERVLFGAKAFFELARAQQIVKPISAELAIAIVYGAFAAMVKGCWTGYLELNDETIDAAESCVWEAIRR